MAKRIESNWHLIKELEKLNPAVRFDRDETCSYVSIDCEPEALILPPPFYYNEKNGITNKHKTTNGVYLTLKVW